MEFIYFILAIAALVVSYFVAMEFADIAEMKGHERKKYFWYTFILGVIGMLMVVALPNQNLPAERVTEFPQKRTDFLSENTASAQSILNTTVCNSHKEEPAVSQTKMAETVQVTNIDGQIVCPVCGTTQRSNRTVCWNCGQRFEG